MRVAFIRYPEALYASGKVLRGGSEIANQSIINYFRRNGVGVVEFSPKNTKRLELIDIPALGTPLVFQDLISQIEPINSCDVVVTTNWFGLIMPEIKKPVVTIYHHDARLVLETIQNPIDPGTLGKWLELARVMTLAYPSPQSIHEEVISIEEQYAASHSTAIIAVSHFLGGNLIKHYNIDRQKLTVIPNAFPAEWNHVEIEKNFDLPKLKVTCVTRLPADYNGFLIKGADLIFEVMSKLRDVDKTLVASTQNNSYSQFIQRHIPDLDFIENASRKQVQEELARSHISLHASRCESYGLSVVESMLMRNIPVVFPTGIAEEIIINGKNGFLVTNTSEAVEIIKSLNEDRDKARAIGLEARRTVIDKLSVESIGGQYIKVLESVIESSK